MRAFVRLVYFLLFYFEELFFRGDFYLYQLYHVADEVGISGQARLELGPCILHADGSVLWVCALRSVLP